MPSASDAASLRAAQAGVSALVRRDLTAFFNALDLTRPEQARDALLVYTQALVNQYGQIAATTAADWYDTTRAAEKIDGAYRAQPLLPDQASAIEGSVRRAAGGLWTDSPQSALTSLLGPIARYAVQGSRSTITTAAREDPAGARWARVPKGPTTCAFCLVMASRGFVYLSEKTAGEHDKYHNDCDCVVVPDWSDHPALAGYDPDALYAQYKQAREATGSGQLEEILAGFREINDVR